MSRVLVTGANGFVGSALIRRLLEKSGHFVVGTARRPVRGPDHDRLLIHTGLDLAESSDWRTALSGCDCVVHTAARVHVMRASSPADTKMFADVNVAGTRALAQQAAASGVRRFIYLSSIKVLGEETAAGRAFRATDEPAPIDPYGVSKLQAEMALRKISEETGMELVIIRPPLIYGPGVRANFAALMTAVRRGVPLPLGSIDNRRSLVAIENLTDLIAVCVDHPGASGKVLLVSDGEDLSTPELVRRLARAMERRTLLLNVPLPALRMVGSMLGRRAAVQRLCGSLQVDISDTRESLDWEPPISVDAALRCAIHAT